MNLDNRIKSKSDILTSFDVEDAKSFLGQKGYFEDYLDKYESLETSEYGILTEVLDNGVPFKSDDRCHWRFFIPENRLKPVEPAEKIDEISILKYKIEKLEKNLIELKRELNNQKTIYNPFAPWTNCCASISYSDGFNPQANCCSNK